MIPSPNAGCLVTRLNSAGCPRGVPISGKTTPTPLEDSVDLGSRFFSSCWAMLSGQYRPMVKARFAGSL